MGTVQFGNRLGRFGFASFLAIEIGNSDCHQSGLPISSASEIGAIFAMVVTDLSYFGFYSSLPKLLEFTPQPNSYQDDRSFKNS